MSGLPELWGMLVVPETGPDRVPQATDLLNAYLPVLLIAFMVTLFTVPMFRLVAIRFGVIDRPDGDRKVHEMPIAYLGGAAVLRPSLGRRCSASSTRGGPRANV